MLNLKWLPARRSPWRRLRKSPRLRAGSFTLRSLGKRIAYADGASCASAGASIFDQHIYAFDSLTPAPRIIDCGANIGLAILYWKNLFPRARITAFEADSAIFGVLEENVKHWGYSDVELIRAAIADRDGEAVFVSDGADAGHLRMLAAGEGGEGGNESNFTSVRTVALSHYLNEPIDFLKVDIEGAEVDVLSSVADQLQCVERLFVEWHSFVGQPQRLHTLLEVLVNSGFRVHCQPEFFSKTPYLQMNCCSGMDNRMNLFALRQ